MNRIKKALEKKEIKKLEFTPEQKVFLQNEEFSWNEYIDCWLFEDSKDKYTIVLYAHESGRFDLYIKELQSDGFTFEYFVEETYFFGENDMVEKFNQLVEKIEEFFQKVEEEKLKDLL